MKESFTTKNYEQKKLFAFKLDNKFMKKNGK